MIRLKVGIVDYGVGNFASVRNTLNCLGISSRISDDHAFLQTCDLLLLPGVGAFKPAMQALERKGLNSFLIDQANRNKPLIGICLGMQLFGNSSMENGRTSGLGLIPGDVTSLGNASWHIGWNSTIPNKADPLFELEQDQDFYFNHSYAYSAKDQFVVSKTAYGNKTFASIIRKGKVVGFQFHPERSQRAGQALLGKVIKGLCDV